MAKNRTSFRRKRTKLSKTHRKILCKEFISVWESANSQPEAQNELDIASER